MTVTKIIRGVGAALLLLLVLPVHRLAPPGAPGSPTEHLRALTGSYYMALWSGVIVVAVISVALGLTRIPRRLEPLLARGKKVLLLPGPWSFALVAGAASGVLALLLSVHGFALQPALLDATSQLIHARYLAAGELAGPQLSLAEFFTFQHMVNLPSGWSSQYPPGHLLMLALGFTLGAPWLVGPIMTMVAVTFATRLAEDLLPDALEARLGGAFLAVSLFFLAHSATYMNHVSAAAFGAAAVFAGIRSAGTRSGGARRAGARSAGAPSEGTSSEGAGSEGAPSESAGSEGARSAGAGVGGEGRFAWAAVAGVGTGMAFATRPLSGVVIGAVVVAATWMLADAPRGRLRAVASRLPAFAAGAVPLLLAVALYNQRLFGAPTTFGYVAAQGPGHGMGFHEDPWGTLYSPAHAVAQLSSDLMALGVDLLLTPVSAVLAVAAWLVFLAPSTAAVRLLLLWALLPVGLHFFYWHQDLFLGPRLLNEFALPWSMLTAMAVVAWIRRSRTMPRPRFPKRFDPGGAVLSAVLVSAVVASTLMIPDRIATYASQWGAEARTPAPDAPEGAVVFVHGDWSERLGARLAGRGLRVDSVRTALRYNTSCEVQELLDASEDARETAPTLAQEPPRQAVDGLRFQPRPGVQLMELRLPTGTLVQTYPDEAPGPECVRELRADRNGVLPLADLLWRGDLPGLLRGDPLFVRDLGPELNARLLETHPEREPFMYLRPDPAEGLVLLPYEEGIQLLW